VVHFSLSDSEGRTPLIWAVDRGSLSAVEILVAKGAEINAKVGLPSPSLVFSTGFFFVDGNFATFSLLFQRFKLFVMRSYPDAVF